MFKALNSRLQRSRWAIITCTIVWLVLAPICYMDAGLTGVRGISIGTLIMFLISILFFTDPKKENKKDE